MGLRFQYLWDVFVFKIRLSFRQLMFFTGGVTLLILLALYFIEYGLHQSPCSLCLLQRYALWGLGLIAMIAALHAPRLFAIKVGYIIGTFAFSCIGFLFALRQIWIQHLPPDSVPNCVADLERLLKYQPLWEVFKTVLTGGGECREIHFKILGLSLAEGAVILFVCFIIYSLMAFILLIQEEKRRT